MSHTWRGGREIAYKDVVRKPEGKKLLQRLRSKLDYNIKMDIKGIGWEDIDYIHVAQNKRPLVGRCEHCKEVCYFTLPIAKIKDHW
jgi:hypothetical protein